MKACRAEFVASAFTARDFPKETLPEVVFAGRSNVGKSSLINKLVGQKNLARISSVPGKTQSINFYRLNQRIYLVDLPGYGFANAPRVVSQQWKHLIEAYFENRSAISLAVHLVDSRIDPTDLDFQLAAWLDRLTVPRLVVATKADKLSGNGRAVQARILSKAFGGAAVILSSAQTGAGCNEIWKRVEDIFHNLQSDR